MKQKQIIFCLVLMAVHTACNDNSGSSADQAATEATNTSTAMSATTVANTSTSTNTVSTDDPAIAIIQNNQVRFKLHGLPEVVPDPSAPGKPSEGKKVYAADISVEYLAGHEKSAAEYMLSSYIRDDKGNKHSLPMGSTKLAMMVSDAQAQQDNAAGTAFNESNPPTGKKYRGRQYGFEMDAANKPVKWGMMLDGKEVEVDIK